MGEQEKNQLVEELWQNLLLKGGKKIYFPPICTVRTWGEKYNFERGKEYDFFWKIYTPGKNIHKIFVCRVVYLIISYLMPFRFDLSTLLNLKFILSMFL